MILSDKYFPEANIKIPLFVHQIDSISWMNFMERQNKGFILADTMGLGKTRTSAFLMELHHLPKTLIIAPKNVLYQWATELLTTSKNHYIFISDGRDINQVILDSNGKIDMSKTKYPLIAINKIKNRPVVVVSTIGAVKPNTIAFDFKDKKMQEKIIKDLEKDNDIPYDAKILEITPYRDVVWDRVILDEAHSIRNGLSVSEKTGMVSKIAPLRFKRMMKLLMSENGIRIALTGTPIQNKLSDIVSIFKWVKVDIPEFGVVDELIVQWCKEYMFRRTENNLIKELREIIKFPEEPYENNIVKIKYLSGEEAAFYEIMAKAITVDINGNTIDNYINNYSKILSKNGLDVLKKTRYPFNLIEPASGTLLKLNDLLLLSSSTNTFISYFNNRDDEPPERDENGKKIKKSKKDFKPKNQNRRLPEWRGTESKFDMISDKVLEFAYNNESVVIFITYKDEKDVLLNYINNKFPQYPRNLGYDIFEINGDVSALDRQNVAVETKKLIEKGRRCMLIAGIKSSAEGLNLQHFSNVIIVTPNWNPKNEEQAIARVHRIGQKKRVKVFRYMHDSISGVFNNNKNISEDVKRKKRDEEDEEEDEEDDTHFDEDMVEIYVTKLQNKKNDIFNKFVGRGENAAWNWSKTTMPDNQLLPATFFGI